MGLNLFIDYKHMSKDCEFLFTVDCLIAHEVTDDVDDAQLLNMIAFAQKQEATRTQPGFVVHFTISC